MKKTNARKAGEKDHAIGHEEPEEFGLNDESAVGPESREALQAACDAIGEARRSLIRDARVVATKFNETRNALIGQPGVKFMGVTLSVTDKSDVLKARWIELIFRDKKLKLRKTLPNQNAERSHLGTLLAKAPEEFHDAIKEAEMAMRAIRRKARKLNDARRLVVEAGLVGTGAGYAAPAEEEGEGQDDIPHF